MSPTEQGLKAGEGLRAPEMACGEAPQTHHPNRAPLTGNSHLPQQENTVSDDRSPREALLSSFVDNVHTYSRGC